MQELLACPLDIDKMVEAVAGANVYIDVTAPIALDNIDSEESVSSEIAQLCTGNAQHLTLLSE